MDASRAAAVQSELSRYAATLKGYRGPFLGDGIREGINGYKLAELLLEASAMLAHRQASVAAGDVTQKMVYAGVKEGVRLGLLPRFAHGEDDYLRMHQQLEAVLRAAWRSETSGAGAMDGVDQGSMQQAAR